MSNKKVYFLESKHRTGPSYSDQSVVDSECGSFLSEWRIMQEKYKNKDILYKRALRPIVYIQKEKDNIISASQQAEQLYEDNMEQRFNQYGYKTDHEIMLERDNNDELRILPRFYTTCNHQPSIDKHLFEIESAEDRYFQMTEIAFKMPHMSYRRSGYVHAKTESLLVDERSKMSAQLAQITEDISNALQGALNVIYPDSYEPVEIILPHRSQLDLSTIKFLSDENVISPAVASSEYANAVGLNKEKVQERVSIVKKKKSHAAILKYQKSLNNRKKQTTV